MIVPVKIQFASSFHHGSGFGVAGLVDRGVLRDGNGIPYLAGSSLKGRFRHALLRMDGGLEACADPTGTGAFCRNRDSQCRLCRLFGSPWNKGEWEFGDAFPDEDLANAVRSLEKIRIGALHSDSTIRRQTSMDRVLGKVREQLLFSTELLDGGWLFVGEVDGVRADDLSVLRHCAKLVTHLGSGQSRGHGRCEITVLEAKPA